MKLTCFAGKKEALPDYGADDLKCLLTQKADKMITTRNGALHKERR